MTNKDKTEQIEIAWDLNDFAVNHIQNLKDGTISELKDRIEDTGVDVDDALVAAYQALGDAEDALCHLSQAYRKAAGLTEADVDY